MKIDVGQAEVVTLRAGSLDVVLDKAKGVVRVVLPDGGVTLTEPQAHLLGRWLTELTQEDQVAEMVGWHEWGGGKCPVRAETRVEIKGRNGAIDIGQAGKFRWMHDLGTDTEYDIVAYRVVP